MSIRLSILAAFKRPNHCGWPAADMGPMGPTAAIGKLKTWGSIRRESDDWRDNSSLSCVSSDILPLMQLEQMKNNDSWLLMYHICRQRRKVI